MRVIIDGTGVTLDDAQLLGEGGEARVYALGDEAVKIFTTTSGPLARLRERKLARFPAGLPDNVLAPRGLVHDEQGAVVGYRMNRVRDAIDLARLARPQAASLVDKNAVLALFVRLSRTLAAVHARDVVVGDLNDGNVLVDDGGRGRPVVIDTDSLQFAGLACPVAHERFLDPRLYGADLTAAPRFHVEHDHYALRVLLLQSLCFVHPYGGVHARHPTLLRRAEARHSVFRDDVMLPRVALPLATLPEALAVDLRACFDDDARTVLDERLLGARYARCGCGVEHARARCPVCSVVVAVPAAVPTGVARGAVSCERLVHTRGVIVAAAVVDGRLTAIVDDGEGRWLRDAQVLLEGARAHEVTACFAGRRTWLALAAGDDDCALVCIDGGLVVDRTSTGRAFGAPACCASPLGLFRVHGDAIVQHGTGVVVGRALRRRTWLFPSDDGCLALWRAGRMVRAQWCRPGLAPVDVALPPLDGRIDDLAVVADGPHALVTMTIDDGGRRRARATLLSQKRGVVAHVEGASDAHVLLGNVRGKVLRGTTVLTTSAHGLVVVDVDAGAFIERARFADTASHIDDSVDLLSGSGGDLYVAGPREIHLLRRRAAT